MTPDLTQTPDHIIQRELDLAREERDLLVPALLRARGTLRARYAARLDELTVARDTQRGQLDEVKRWTTPTPAHVAHQARVLEWRRAQLEVVEKELAGLVEPEEPDPELARATAEVRERIDQLTDELDRRRGRAA